jgi:hypothetical protein
VLGILSHITDTTKANPVFIPVILQNIFSSPFVDARRYLGSVKWLKGSNKTTALPMIGN